MTSVQLRARRGDIRAELQSIVNKLTRQVMADWHDGWSDQAETTGDWFLALQDPLQEVLTVGVGKKKHLAHCHEVLMILVQSWNDLKEVNSRIDVTTMLAESCDDLSFNIDVPWSETSMKITTMRYGSQPKDLFAYIWNALLRTHASLSDTDEKLLLQCIKDAYDNNGDDTTFDGPLCDPWDHTDDDPPDDPGAPDGTALARIMKENELEWKGTEENNEAATKKKDAISADEKALLDAGWTSEGYEKYIVPLGNSSPWKERDPDADNLAWIDTYDEPMDSSEFLWVEYGQSFEHLDLETNELYVPMFDIEKMNKYKKLTKDTSALIGKILFNNRRLVYLDIANLNRVDEDIAHAFFQHWHGKNCRLQCLNMDDTGLGGRGFNHFIQRLLHNNTELVELKLTNTKLTNENAGELASVLSSGPSTLLHLSLMNNQLSDEGAKLISEAVCNMPNLETIDLMGNNITKYNSISKMLQSPKLRKINLRFCFGSGHWGKVSPAESSKLMIEFEKSFQRETNQYRTYMVLVPNGIRPGMQFPVVIEGRKVTLTCPDGAQAGMKLRIRVQTKQPATKQPAWKFTGCQQLLERK